MFKISNFKKSMLDAVRSKCLKCLDLINAQVRSASSSHPETAIVNLEEYFFKMTLDTIGEIAFGQDLGSLSGKNIEFMRAFDFCQMYASDLFFLPGPAWFWNYCTPLGWRFRRQTQVLETHATCVVKEMITRALDEGALQDDPEGENREDVGVGRKETILSYFLQKESQESLKNDLRTVRYLSDVIMNFQIAGRDTVAQAFSWAVHLLSLHPDVQEKAHHEALLVLGSLRAAEAATFDQINRLEYMRAVVTEVLRLYPSVPKEGKWVFKDDALPDGSRVSKGSWVVFSPYVMGRLESLWADAAKFKPERHLDKPKPSNFVFTAFQGGPRICMGMNLAYMQLQYGLALLLLSCQFAPLNGGEDVLPLQHSTTLPTQRGVRVNVTLRDTARDYPTFTPDGIEESLQINHLSHFLLVSLLLDDLKKAKDPRCVIVGSITGNDNTIAGAFVWPRASLGDLKGMQEGAKEPVSMIDGKNFNGAKAYKDSKVTTTNGLGKYHLDIERGMEPCPRPRLDAGHGGRG